MPAFLQRILSGTLSSSIVALPLLLCAPMLAKHYQQKTLYRIMLILTAAFLLMPIRPQVSRSIVILPVPNATTEKVQAITPLQQHSVQENVIPSDRIHNAAPFSDETLDFISPSASAKEKEYSYPSAVPMALILPHKQSATFSFWQLVTPVYCLGAAGLCLFHLVRHARFTRFLRRWQSIRLHGCYEVILQEECERLHIRHMPAIYLCEAAPSPMLTGIFNPRICLPDKSLSIREVRLVLRHELTHMKRLDIPFKALSLISLCLNWFNPLCHVLHKQMDYYCETSCDEQVLRDASWADVERYTASILSTLRRSIKSRSALSTHFSGGKKRMKNRILTMMDAGKKRLGALVCALVIVLTASSTVFFSFGHAEMTAENNPASPEYLIPDDLYIHADAYASLVTALNATETGDGTLPLPVAAYTYNPLDFAVPACNGPTSWSMPDGQYLPGVPVQILGYTHTAGTIKGYTADDGMFYAEVRLLGDEDLYCYIPLVFLSAEKPATPECTVTLKTDDPIGFVSVFTERSLDSIPMNAYQAGTQLQLIGRQSGWYHVQIGSSVGYVKEENATLSPEAEKLFNNQLFRFEGFFDYTLLGSQQEMELYYRLIEQAYEIYGDEKAFWTMEQRAWYSRLTMDYGQLAEGMDVNVLPTEKDMTTEQALKKAIEHIVANGDEAPNLTWYAVSYALFYNYGDDPENAQWRVSLWPIDRRLSRYAINMDKTGECTRFYEEEAKSEEKILQTWHTLYDFDQYFRANPDATADGMPEELLEAYKQWTGDRLFSQQASYNADLNVRITAQNEYGLNNYFWPLEVRMDIFGGENTLPQDGEMTLEQAQEKAVQAVIDQLGQDALDALGNYKVGAILQRIDEGLETEFTRWCLFITDDPDTMLNGYRVDFVDKGSDRLGDGATVQSIDDISNG